MTYTHNTGQTTGDTPSDDPTIGAYASDGETVTVDGDAVGSTRSGSWSRRETVDHDAPSGGNYGVVNNGGVVTVGGNVAGTQYNTYRASTDDDCDGM